MTTLTTQQTELLDTVQPLVDYAFKALQAGVLRKNVIKYFTNKGFTFPAAENITDMAVVKVENFAHYAIN